MKMRWFLMLLTMTGLALAAEMPVRLAVLDFMDETGKAPDARLTGGLTAEALAQKGADILARELLESRQVVLIDRRDLMRHLEAAQGPRPSFLHAAQTLNVDAVIRGKLTAFSTGRRTVRQGGYQTDFTDLRLRVGVEALDAVDGTIIAAAEGTASDQVRQTAAVETELSEDDVLKLLARAVESAVPSVLEQIQQYRTARASRPRVKISVKTTADPALVEIDGLLVGTTPLENFEVYAGDHVLTVGKAGYRDVSQRILLQRDTAIEVPMIRTELTAEEWKDILEKVRMQIVVGQPALLLTPLE